MDARVRDVMTPGAIGVEYSRTIGETARTMRDWGVGAVLVVRDRSLYGVVTDRDLVIRSVAESRAPDEAVGSLCSTDVISVDADAHVAEAARLMRRNDVCRLPVMSEGLVVGIVSVGDLVLHENPAAPPPDIRRVRATA
jgi:signal-transduction protein with cAMP-binding, CBS, and nucleotidyltransferase domain